MNSVIGFSLELNLEHAARERHDRAAHKTLARFPWLKSSYINIGKSRLHMWGHGDLNEAFYELDEGELLLIIGSPVGSVSAESIRMVMRVASDAPDKFTIPWDGRILLLRISSDGQRWTLWNDWAGSIPVFHARIGEGRIASTLEPVVVAAAGYTPNDFFAPSLLSLLINGHFLGDWTLFKEMKVVPPDCVAEWNQAFRWKRLWTVKPSTERWETSWDDLIDEMYELSRQAIAASLKTQPAWILPLSGGMDSRLIAAVGAEIGTEFYSYTYGRPDWGETIYARQVAGKLKIPWQRVSIDPLHLARHTPMWLEWFGSALHCHGMYQMPFLNAVRDLDLPIVTGFAGDPLAGAQTMMMMRGATDRPLLERLLDKWLCCSIEQARRLLNIDFEAARDAVESELRAQESTIEGSLFQRVWLIFQWNHVFGFSYYQPMMYDYWKGVGTPYVSRSLAQFCLSLPRAALDNRRLQKEMLNRYYPSMAIIGGTFGDMISITGRHLVKRRLAFSLPKRLIKGPLQEFAPAENTIQTDALRMSGEKALWPLNRVRNRLSDWFNLTALEKTYQQAASGNEESYIQLRPVQAVAWHFVGDDD